MHAPIKTFRPNPGVVLLFAAFGVAGILLLVACPAMPLDLRFGSLLTGVLYLLIGSIAVALVGARTDVSGTGIRIRQSMFATPFFATWDEVQSFEFRHQQGTHIGTGSWFLKTRNAEQRLPHSLDDYAGLLRAILLRLPTHKIEAPQQHRQWNTVAGEIELRDRNLYEIIAASLGFLLMVGGPIAWWFQPHTDRWLMVLLAMWAPLFIFGIVATPVFIAGLRAGMRRDLKLDPAGVYYRGKFLPWQDLLLFESRLQYAGKGRRDYQVSFVGKEVAFTLDNGQNRIGDIEAFAASHAPAEAFVILAHIPFEQS